MTMTKTTAIPDSPTVPLEHEALDNEVRTVALTYGITYEGAAALCVLARFDALASGIASIGSGGFGGMLASMFGGGR